MANKKSKYSVGSRPLLSRSGCIYVNVIDETLESFGSRPLLSRSGCIYNNKQNIEYWSKSSRPLLSRSGCILNELGIFSGCYESFSSPFIEERLYLCLFMPFNWPTRNVLVPFYRGAVVFKCQNVKINLVYCSRPLLSRSGCILLIAPTYNKK